MFQKTMAFAVRAMRVDARSRMSHLLRLGLAAIILLFLFFIQNDNSGPSAAGLSLFNWIVYTNAFLLTLIAPLYFANAITEEKEERTLSLLKVANVGPTAIVLGKSLPRLLTLIFVVIVQFPFALLAITLGGVTFPQVIATYVSLLAYSVAVGCLALFCSTMMRLTANAVGAAGLLLLGYHVGPLILMGITQLMQFNQVSPAIVSVLSSITDGLRQSNVFTQVGVSMQSGFEESWLSVQVCSNLIAAAIFFLLSILTFNYFNQNIDAVSSAKPKKSTTGLRASRRSWANAIIWKEFVFGSGGLRYTLAKFVAYGVILLGIAFLFSDFGRSSPPLEDLGSFFISITFFCFIPLEITMMVSRLFHPEIRHQTLSTLVMLPLTIREICWSKIIGGLLGVIPVFSYLLIGLLMNLELVGDFLEMFGKEPIVFSLTTLNVVAHVLLFWHLIAIFSLSMNGWWAICLAAILHYFGAIIIVMLGALFFGLAGLDRVIDGRVIAFITAMATLSLVAFLHFRIGQQLKVKAAGT